MAHSYHEIAFTPSILDLQQQAGSRDGYAAMSGDERYAHRLTNRETDFLARRDSFYMASVSETGWPYVQHRGGPVGFMKVLDEFTIGFADYAGNRQYVSQGNLENDGRVSLFFMDYPNRRRLKLFGRARIVDAMEGTLPDQLTDPGYPAQVERGVIIRVEGFDWNCPAHITPRFSEDEVRAATAELIEENRRLRSRTPEPQAPVDNTPLGEGSLALVVSAMRQHTAAVRGYELRPADGTELPVVAAGAHLKVPVRLPNGTMTERHFSIASDPARRDRWEIAVLREDDGQGGSRTVHDTFHLGTTLHVDPPANQFALADEAHHAVLIAGGIGITPIKAMAHSLSAANASFELHYAGRQRSEMAFAGSLTRALGDQMTVYAGDEGRRMNLPDLLAGVPADAILYVCGPERLLTGVLTAAKTVGLPAHRVRTELFT